MIIPTKETACIQCFTAQRRPLWDDCVCLDCRPGEYTWPGTVYMADLVHVDRGAAVYSWLSSLPVLEGDHLRVYLGIFHGTAREEDRDAFIASHDWVVPELAGSWFGEIGERYRGVTVYTSDVIDRGMGDYGQMFLAKMQASDPDTGEVCELRWFGGENVWVEVGTEQTADFTVKAHDTYQGIRQTIVQRVQDTHRPKTRKSP